MSLKVRGHYGVCFMCGFSSTSLDALVEHARSLKIGNSLKFIVCDPHGTELFGLLV